MKMRNSIINNLKYFEISNEGCVVAYRPKGNQDNKFYELLIKFAPESFIRKIRFMSEDITKINITMVDDFLRECWQEIQRDSSIIEKIEAEL